MGKNIFSARLHSVPGKGAKELEKIFNYSSDFKKFRLTIRHASFVQKYILEKLAEIENKKTFFTKRELEMILRNLKNSAYITEEQAGDIMSFANGATPKHEIASEKTVEDEEARKIEKKKMPGKSLGDYELAVAASNDLSKNSDADMNMEKWKREQELRRMAEDI